MTNNLPIPTRAESWHKGTPPIQTRWYDEVSPSNAHPEYPRPQMVRADWINLNGLWELGKAELTERPPTGQTLKEQILVPFPVESALSGIMRHESTMWYRHTFDVPGGWAGKHVLLHFGAVDWEAVVYVNGQKVGVHNGGYDGFSFDITSYLKASNPQEVIVRAYDPTLTGGQPVGKQTLNPGGIWYTATSGIWQSVWLEPVEPVCIADLVMTPDIDAGVLRLTVKVSADSPGYTVSAVALDGGAKVASVDGQAGLELKVPVPNAKLWSPDDPFLYDLQVTLQQGNKVVDQVTSYFGMRKISIGQVGGVTRMLLNNRFVFQIGPLDQGFWPDGIYTAPTDDALKYDLEMIKQFGWNVVRKHIKVEPDRWYYWADKLGLLVWQDMPSPDPSNQRAYLPDDFEAQLRVMIEGRRNHPSIVLWVVFNEGWGQAQYNPEGTQRFTKFVKTLDPSRLVTNASGWTDFGVGDTIDIHTYVGPESPKPEPHRAAVQGEFGGLGLRTPDHEWDKNTFFVYEMCADRSALTARYVGLIDKLTSLMQQPGLSAAIYTEITDVEQELNGFLTYDRAVVKVDTKAVHAAHAGLIQASLAVK